MRSFLFLIAGIIPFWTAAQSIDTANCRMVSKLTILDRKFLEHGGIPEISDAWTLQQKRLMGSAVRNHRASIGFTAGWSITLGASAGLLITGLSMLPTNSRSDYATIRTLLYASLGSAGVSVPLFILGQRCRTQAKLDRERLKSISIH